MLKGKAADAHMDKAKVEEVEEPNKRNKVDNSHEEGGTGNDEASTRPGSALVHRKRVQAL